MICVIVITLQLVVLFLWRFASEFGYDAVAVFTTPSLRDQPPRPEPKIMAVCAAKMWRLLRRRLYAGKGQRHMSAASVPCRQQAARPRPGAHRKQRLAGPADISRPSEARFSRAVTSSQPADAGRRAAADGRPAAAVLMPIRTADSLRVLSVTAPRPPNLTGPRGASGTG